MADPIEKIVNLNYLSALAKGNKEFVQEMIDIFLTDNPSELRSLETFIAAKDFDKIKSVAHKLKSTLPFIGLDKIVGEDVLVMESLAASKSDLGGIESRFKKVKEVCEKACSELKETVIQ